MIPLTLSFPLCSHELADSGFSWCVATAEKLCSTSKTENKCVSIIIVRCFLALGIFTTIIVGSNIKHNPPLYISFYCHSSICFDSKVVPCSIWLVAQQFGLRMLLRSIIIYNTMTKSVNFYLTSLN